MRGVSVLHQTRVEFSVESRASFWEFHNSEVLFLGSINADGPEFCTCKFAKIPFAFNFDVNYGVHPDPQMTRDTPPEGGESIFRRFSPIAQGLNYGTTHLFSLPVYGLPKYELRNCPKDRLIPYEI